ncbi:MAG: S-layer homology domain-containing protein, partial [Anaerolineales bacterium]
LDGYAWGGYRWLTLDGVYGRWNLTWEPPWAYSDITIVAHEMGHGFGLPHSSGMYGAVYDNVWDVMSDADANCAKATHVTYGCLGQHTIAYHKDMLGWIPPAYKYTVPYTTGASTPQTTSNLHLMAQIPVLGSSTRFYTLEARNFYGYDVKLPGKAVIIHEVLTTRAEPAKVVDVDLNGNTGDAGAMWVVGETFQDSANQVSVAVLAASGDNFQVRVTNGTQTATFWLMPLARTPGVFTDVPLDYWARSFIERLYNAGITGGCNTTPLMYCPANMVTRDQMAVFLLRGINGAAYTPLAASDGTGFADVPSTYWAAGWIKQLADTGITTGCGNGNYCPTSPVTRDQMAIFLLRAKYGAAYTPPPAGSSTGFADVPTTHWAAAWIKQLAAEGITGGCGNGNYCPSSPVTRDQMAVFLVRTFNLP